MLTTEWCCLVWQLPLYLLLSVTAYFGFYLWFVPMDRVRSAGDVGFAHLRKRQWVNRVRKARRTGNTPPAFPNGWFVIAESREIKRGKLLRVDALGTHYAVFRGESSGKVFVTDAYCPHLGADLAAGGGKVSGDCVKCPFHEWVFRGEDGKCVDIPYSDKVPNFAKLPTHTSMEANGLVYVWHHAEEEEPSWHPEMLPELNDIVKSDGEKKAERWVYQGRNEFEVCCHIQDIPENGADVAHLNAVHRSSILVGGEPAAFVESLFSKLAWHEWVIGWRPETEEGKKHRAVVELKHSMKVGGTGLLDMDVRGEQIGPAFVNLFFDGLFGKGVMLQYVLPLEPMLQKVVHVFYTQRSWLPPMAKLVLYGESILVERDIAIWNSKMYQDKPLLVAEDSLILKHRRWYSQFYTENSRKKGEKSGVDADLDW